MLIAREALHRCCESWWPQAAAIQLSTNGGDLWTGPNGARVDAGKPQISGNTMHVGLKAAGPGTYHVRWHVLSVDTHKTEGNFTFRVGGP